MKLLPFSVYERSARLEQMSEQELDLLIVGGGITGAGIALDAASRGLSVGLVEKQDFGAGTSSRSTKLIHGGLRYLKQGEFNIVKEVGSERAILYRNAPHIVIPEKMLLPLVAGGTYGKLATSFGLWLYDRLAGVTREERRVMLSGKETKRLEPLLRDDILKGGGLYIEYRTDDARLTIEVMKTATLYGALCVNYSEATDLIYDRQKLSGIEVTDLINGKTYKLNAKKIVNAAGPWGDLIRDKDHSLSGKRLHLTKGVHLVVPYGKFPLRQSVYFDVPDKRMIFAIPRGKATYFGTTDTNYQGSLEQPRVTEEDVSYLLHAVNNMFPSLNLTAEDITSSWAGLRPLIHEDGKSPSELSRKDEIFLSPSGLITIAGGKLTGFRKMAERVVNLVAEQLESEEGKRVHSCFTDTIILSGGEFSTPDAVPFFIEKLNGGYAETLHLDQDYIKLLVGKYGVNAENILKAAYSIMESRSDLTPEISLVLAELDYCLNEEMVTNLNDFFIRRTGMMLFDRNAVEGLLPIVLDEISTQLNWDSEQQTRYTDQFLDEYQSAVTFI